jgi:hypothetical protein
MEKFSDGIHSLVGQAEDLLENPTLRQALRRLPGDSVVARFALTAPGEFLAEQGIDVPPDLDVRFIRTVFEPGHGEIGYFVPDFEFFTIRQDLPGSARVQAQPAAPTGMVSFR